MTLRLFGDLKDAGALDEWAAPSGGGGGAEFPAIRPIRNGTSAITFPTTGQGLIVVVPTGTDWSAWVELTAGEGVTYILATLNTDLYHRESRPLLIQLGTGASPSNNIIGQWYDHVDGPPAGQTVSYPRQYDIDGITLPASTALAARVRAITAATAAYNQVGLAVAAMPTPLTFAPDWDEQAYRGGITRITRAPDIPDTIALTSGAADQYGDWVELLASASGHLLVQGIEVTTSGSGSPPRPHLTVQVGIGPTSGNVTPQEAAPFPTASATIKAAGYNRLPLPVEVLTGDRLWLRAKATSATQAVSAAALLHYLSF